MLSTAAGTRRPSLDAPRRRGPAFRDRQRAARALVLAALVAMAGCARRAPSPPGAPPALPGRPAPGAPAARPRPAPGYVARRDSLQPPDPALLRGRRIAIDPGHGGSFRGCIGVGGLSEADVNLGVALALRELLMARGAEVLLTRDRDRDFLTPADSTLKRDLAERVRIANGFRPDLFVSVHHNADPGGAHDVNETQTYFKLGDDGPSYDAGTDVHRSLVRNLGIETQKLLPGNFAVIRGSEAPALLSEASHLTNPDVEAKLATPQARALEAEALLLGIERFFARQVPVVERFDAARPSPQGAEWSLHTGFPVLTARVRGPFDDVVLHVDGERQAPLVVGDSLYWRPERALPAGEHVATLSARLAGEGSSRPARLSFRLAKAFDRIAADFPGQPMGTEGAPIALRVRALDADGLPIACESLAVRVRARRARPGDTLLIVRDGVAWGYFRGTPAHGRRASLAAPEFVIAREPVSADEMGSHLPEDVVASIGRIEAASPQVVWRTGFARAMPADTALLDAPGTTGPEPALGWINRDGFVTLPADSLGRVRVPQLPGFRAWGPDTAWPPRLVAIAGGALAGKRVVLDPEGGGDDAAGMGPSATRGASLNLEVARALASMLQAAGAEVLLTRASDVALSEVERVQRGEGFRPDRYLRIGHAAAAPVAGHYFSSSGGRRWAERLALACAELGVADSLPVGEVAKYALTQTSATALYASLARVDDEASESRLLAPGALRREAYALWLSLARDFAPAARWTVDSLAVLDAAGAPAPDALVSLGGALVLQAGADGRVRFARTEPGPLDVRVLDPRSAAKHVLLDSPTNAPAGAR